MYDIAIIGGGPAGISAAINAKILNKNFIFFGSASKKVSCAENIQNYLGFCDISGSELQERFEEHLERLNIRRTDKIVTGIYDTGGKFTIVCGNEDFEAKSAILCLGVESKNAVSGEEKFLGRGVSYCATCDGNLYNGKTIAIYATDKRFEDEIKYLCSLAKKAFVIPLYRDFGSFGENAEIVLKKPVAFEGDARLKRVKFADGEIAVDGAFVLRPSTPPATLLRGLKIEDGHVTVDKKQQTSVNGIFAAGDCTGRPYQYAKAVGEGNVAVHSAVEFLGE